MIKLEITKRTDARLIDRMKTHYSKPKGFVGRNICYAVYYNTTYYGHIVGGSATLHLPGRHEYLGTNRELLNNIVNNIFFNISSKDKYPTRNFTTKIVKHFRERISVDWFEKYGDKVLGFETLVELPRTGDLYRKDGWQVVGETIGYSCKRQAGIGTDTWTGKRIWNTKDLKPKLVLCKKGSI